MDESQPGPGAAPWRWRWHALGGLVLVVGLLAGSAWWFQVGRDVAPEGEVVELHASVAAQGDDPAGDLPHARTATVVTPAGVYDLRVSERLDSLEHGDRTEDLGELDDGDHHAPRGSSFVAVQWESVDGPTPLPRPNEGAPSTDVALGQAGMPTLELRSGGETLAGPFDLDDGYPGELENDALAVLVPDDAAVEAVVSFDGVDQVVDLATGELDAGVAAPYYDDDGAPRWSTSEPAPYQPATCTWDVERPRDVLGDDGPQCSALDAVRGPWLPGFGWVDEVGEEWVSVSGLTVRGQTRFDALRHDGWAADGRLGAPLLSSGEASGVEPVEVVPYDDPLIAGEGPTKVVQQVVWLVEAPGTSATITMRGAEVLTPVDDAYDPDPERRRAPLVATVDLGLMG